MALAAQIQNLPPTPAPSPPAPAPIVGGVLPSSDLVWFEEEAISASVATACVAANVDTADTTASVETAIISALLRTDD